MLWPCCIRFVCSRVLKFQSHLVAGSTDSASPCRLDMELRDRSDGATLSGPISQRYADNKIPTRFGSRTKSSRAVDYLVGQKMKY